MSLGGKYRMNWQQCKFFRIFLEEIWNLVSEQRTAPMQWQASTSNSDEVWYARPVKTSIVLLTKYIFVTVHDDVDAPKLDLIEPSLKVSVVVIEPIPYPNPCSPWRNIRRICHLRGNQQFLIEILQLTTMT